MSPMMDEMLVHEVVPRLRNVARTIPKICQDLLHLSRIEGTAAKNDLGHTDRNVTLLSDYKPMGLTTKERVEREKQRREAANTRMREKVAAAKRRGICRCGGKLDKKPGTRRNYSTCPDCREKAKASATRYYR